MRSFHKDLDPHIFDSQQVVLASKDNGKTWKRYIVDRIVYESADKFLSCPGLREVIDQVASDYWEHPYNFIFDYSK